MSETRFHKARRGGSRLRAFTLIELLIVVAIIAILAAIAVPNFLEAQVRSKVSRMAADVRTLKTGLEAYRVDTNKYPETDLGQENLLGDGVGMIRMTTPIAYITSIPRSPFEENKAGNPGTPKNSNKYNIPLYVRAEPYNTSLMPSGVSGAQDSLGPNNVDDNFDRDRFAYMYAGPTPPTGSNQLAALRNNEGAMYMLKSVGPDNEDDRNLRMDAAEVYDPTNGTISWGDLVTFQDTTIWAQPR